MKELEGISAGSGFDDIDSSAKVVVASGYAITRQVKETFEAGAAGYIGKPYTLTGLLEEVRNVLDRDDSSY